MIRLRMTAPDLERMRFAYSPLTEVAESLYMLHSGRINPLHRGWFEMMRADLRRVDTDLLRVVIPGRGRIAGFLLGGITDGAAGIESQLELLTRCPPAQLRADLDRVWHGDQLPAAARQFIADGASGAARLADALWQYWQVAIEPCWRQIRALLDADVAYRAGRLARGGIEALMSDLHPQLEMVDQALQIVCKPTSEHDLTDTGRTAQEGETPAGPLRPGDRAGVTAVSGRRSGRGGGSRAGRPAPQPRAPRPRPGSRARQPSRTTTETARCAAPRCRSPSGPRAALW